MNEDPISKDLMSALWSMSDIFRGIAESSVFKDYILVMFFLKYISDLWLDRYEEAHQKYGDDEDKILLELQHERIILPEGCDFYALYEQRYDPDLGAVINNALQAIEKANESILGGVFGHFDFASEDKLGTRKQRNDRLATWLGAFNDPRLDLRPSRIGDLNIVGNIFEHLKNRFAMTAGKKSSTFTTPPEVSRLLAMLLDVQPNDRIYDPACGTGSLLIECVPEVEGNDYLVAGQEIDGRTWGLAKLNLFLHGINGDYVVHGDTLRDPLLLDQGHLMRFNVVVSNPPYSRANWGIDQAEHDHLQRFRYGIPPQRNGDFAFISHIVESMAIDPIDQGRAGVIVAHGVLFRGGTEGEIRQRLIEDNLIDAVIGLPANLFYGTSIPTAIIVFKQNKTDNSILFIDASQRFVEKPGLNALNAQIIDDIVDVYRRRETEKNFSYLAEFEEVNKNDFNLNLSRYIFPIPEDEFIQISECKKTYDIFLSYSRENKDRMEEIYYKLVESGLNVWADQDLDFGTADWQLRIQEAIENSCAIVILLSPSAKDSVWVNREILYAETFGLRKFPIIVEGNDKTSIPIVLIDVQHTIFTSDKLDLVVEDIWSSIGVKKAASPYYNNELSPGSWPKVKLGEMIVAVKPNKDSFATEGVQCPVYRYDYSIDEYLPTYKFSGVHSTGMVENSVNLNLT